ncbi:MAG: hypothetical protein GX167_09300, partial [Firmicutes bacterium]|nr:hypothetical protein [Bacillota bacterium]
MSDLTLWSWVFVGLYIIGIVILTYIGARRTKTLEDFTTAPRSYGWVVISFATVAAWCSAAAFLGQPGMGYGTGFPALWYVMGYSFSALCWALSMFGIWKVGAKLGAKTPADFLGKRFNSDLVKAVTALIVILNIYYVAGQFVGIGWLFNVALKIPYLYGVIVAAAFTAIYIIIGGTHSDLLTDAAQGMSMAVAAILVLFVAFLFVTPGGVPAVNASIVAQDPQLGWDNIFSSGNAMFAAFPAISICFGLGFGAISPQMSKNFLAIKNKKDVYKVAIAGAVLMFLMSFMMLGGIGARAALGDQFVAQPDMALPTLLTQSLPAPLAALIAIAILAAIMSSADGLYLVIANAISVDLYKDIIAP